MTPLYNLNGILNSGTFNNNKRVKQVAVLKSGITDKY